MLLVLEVVDEHSKLEPLLPQIKRLIDDNGMVTLNEVDLICHHLNLGVRDLPLVTL
jgi:PII-like signaling protein